MIKVSADERCQHVRKHYILGALFLRIRVLSVYLTGFLFDKMDRIMNGLRNLDQLVLFDKESSDMIVNKLAR